ncbi:hypothetical protein V6R21_01775 [Limibacter armeniacum]|uniref:hypothetical protein n=1 Tax=Limibacter armeniacum TaxID=466084 RepID=UPI002FE55993
MLYIEFDILDQSKFTDFQYIYTVIADLKRHETQESMSFWNKLIPDYAKAYFPLNDKTVIYNHITFEQLVEYLQCNLDAEFDALDTIEKNRGRLDFTAFGYPYGGMDWLILFLKAFDCPAYQIYNGFNTNKVTWTADFDFECEVIDK